MNIVVWIMIGSVLGVIFDILSSEQLRGGIIGAIFLGMIGAIMGGFTAYQLIDTSIFSFNIQSFTFAIVGSISLLAMSKLFSIDITKFHRFEH